MKKILFILIMPLLLISCEKDIPYISPIQNNTISGDITEDLIIKSSDENLLEGFVYVKEGVTVTIEPGSIIKGVSGTKATLIIERGATIIAEGTKNNPIVFTSDKPIGQRSYGDWGGVVINGYAPTNKHDNGEGIGIAEGGIGTVYGGDNPQDNSGIIKYVRIEFAGVPLTSIPNSEINGLTLYSVGDQTTIEYVQVSYSGDDSFEWFGGNVNAKYLIAYNGWDDDFDTDNGYSGMVQFFLSIRDPEIADQSGSNAFESDNDSNGSTLSPYTNAIFVNGTVFGPLHNNDSYNSLYQHAIQIRRGSRLSIYNSVFSGYPYGLYIDGQKGDSPQQAQNGILQMENNVMTNMENNFKNTYFENIESWYLTNNEILNINDLKLNNFILLENSPLSNGASFTNERLNNPFFNIVNYRGAFNQDDWTEGWSNFDPLNTEY